MTNEDLDTALRLAAFAYLGELTREREHPVVGWDEVHEGFRFRGGSVPLIGASGIWKPACLDLPISVTTAPPRPNRQAPYDDRQSEDGAILYRYRGTDPSHPQNRGLLRVADERRPLIYFFGLSMGRYFASWPVLVLRNDEVPLAVRLQVDDATALGASGGIVVGEGDPRRAYITTQTRRRLHQAAFRQRVIVAYRGSCSICRLRRESLVEASHIIPDAEGGEPRVSNGLALCKIHHAAFDQHILGITPDYEVQVRSDVLDEEDGPMLQHGLKEMHGGRLVVLPRIDHLKPDRGLLARRYERFRAAR